MTQRNTERPAFTLMELLVVLAILTLITALGVPSVTRMYHRAQFKDSVFELQAELGRARLLAMKSGTAILFRYIPNTNIYQVIPKTALEESLVQKERLRGGELLSDLETDSSNVTETQQALPGVGIFTGGMISGATGANLSVNLTRGASEADLGSAMIGSLGAPFGNEEAQADPWSEPIVFYPNGRTSNAVLFLASTGEIRYYSEVALRGMTGTARVSSISASPPGSPEFPSVLPPEAFARMNRERTANPDSPFSPDAAFVDGGFAPADAQNISGAFDGSGSSDTFASPSDEENSGMIGSLNGTGGAP